MDANHVLVSITLNNACFVEVAVNGLYERIERKTSAFHEFQLFLEQNPLNPFPESVDRFSCVQDDLDKHKMAQIIAERSLDLVLVKTILPITTQSGAAAKNAKGRQDIFFSVP